MPKTGLVAIAAMAGRDEEGIGRGDPRALRWCEAASPDRLPGRDTADPPPLSLADVPRAVAGVWSTAQTIAPVAPSVTRPFTRLRRRVASRCRGSRYQPPCQGPLERRREPASCRSPAIAGRARSRSRRGR